MAAKGAKKSADDRGEWVALAWSAWCAGERSLAALGRQFNKAPATVKANLQKYSRQRAAEMKDGTDPTAEYVDGLEYDLREALRLYRAATQESTQIGCLKHAMALREKLAAARGVVTERKSHELTGAAGGPVQIIIEGFTGDGDADGANGTPQGD